MDIPAALTLGKTGIEIAKGMLTLTKDAAITQKAIELQQIILDLQQQLQQAAGDNDEKARHIRNLEDELRRKKDLDRYKLVSLEGGAKVYALPDNVLSETGEIPHYLCPTCFTDGKKAVLHGLQDSGILSCHVCKSNFRQKERRKLRGHPGVDWRTI